MLHFLLIKLIYRANKFWGVKCLYRKEDVISFCRCKITSSGGSNDSIMNSITLVLQRELLQRYWFEWKDNFLVVMFCLSAKSKNTNVKITCGVLLFSVKLQGTDLQLKIALFHILFLRLVMGQMLDKTRI